MRNSQNRLVFLVVFCLGLGLLPSLIKAFPLWLDAPARSNPHDPKSAAFALTLVSSPGTPGTSTVTPGVTPATNTPTPSYSYTPAATNTPLAATPTGTSTKTKTASPSPTPGCAPTDKLDLSISVDGSETNPCVASENYQTVMFKIVNNSAVGVNINTLSINAWFNGDVIKGGWGGESWRTTVYNSSNASQGTATCSITSVNGTYGSMNNQVTFAFTDSVIIPAGGYVIAGTTAFGAVYQLYNAGTSFDSTCSNYSDFGGGTFYTAGVYYQNPHWVLYESGNSVCEYTNSSTPDSATGIPAGGATCNCPVGPSPTNSMTPVPNSPTTTPSKTPSPTPSPTTGFSVCATTDKLDLLIGITTSSPSNINPCVGNYPEVLFKIVNNSSNPVDINTLSVKAWFNAAITVGWGTDSWRTTVYDSSNASLGGATSTITLASGTYGSMITQATFAFTDSVVIPAGGYVLAGQGGIGFCQLIGPGPTFDATCNDYSNWGDGTFYTAGTYYENPGWVLYESGNPVCEWDTASTTDPNSGIPSGGATCSCPVGPTRTSTPALTSTPTMTASPSSTISPTFTPVGGVCATTDKLDLLIGITTSSPTFINPCVGNYPEVLFKIVNNSSNPVDINTLSVKAWFNAAITVGWGTDSWRTTVYDSSNASLGGATSTITLASGTYGSMITQATFAFTDSVVIPAGGYVLAGQGGIGFCQLIGPGPTFDATCNDYSNWGDGTFYTAGTYYENPGWVLYESGNPVCEWSDGSTKDASTGIPAGGVVCSCP